MRDEPTFLHLDLDAFFASVEQRDDPTLRGRPVIVGGTGGRGVVAAASYEAREFGVRSAMPTIQAERLCPNGVFLPPRFDAYQKASRAVMKIMSSVTSLVEPLSLDEAFLDVTGSRKLFGSGRNIAELIRKRVFASEKITCSVGIATTKFIAKLASGRCKPNGILEIAHDRVLTFLHPLPVSEIWGVGPKTNEELQALGLRTVADIANTPLETLKRALGSSAGVSLYELAWARDYREVVADAPEKSISAAETFAYDLEDQDEIFRELLRLTERAGARLRARSLRSKTIGLKVRFSDFSNLTRSKTLPLSISGSHEIYEVVKDLYLGLKIAGSRIRLLGVSLEQLVDQSGAVEQLELGERELGWSQAQVAIDRAIARFGSGSVKPARLVGEGDDESEDS